MTTASLELCKELYELSGWDMEEYGWFGDNEKAEAFSWRDSPLSDMISPAYDLGYLLRNLPISTRLVRVLDDSWIANLTNAKIYDKNAEADSPEDAACKLAIELFKQGVLE